MAKQSSEQQKTVARVMHEFKHGELDKADGTPVEDPKQAIAIALHEAGAANQESPSTNRQNLRKTKQRERQAQTAQARSERKREAGKPRTRAELYDEAKRRGIPRRSTMSKAALEHALRA